MAMSCGWSSACDRWPWQIILNDLLYNHQLIHCCFFLVYLTGFVLQISEEFRVLILECGCRVPGYCRCCCLRLIAWWLIGCRCRDVCGSVRFGPVPGRCCERLIAVCALELGWCWWCCCRVLLRFAWCPQVFCSMWIDAKPPDQPLVSVWWFRSRSMITASDPTFHFLRSRCREDRSASQRGLAFRCTGHGGKCAAGTARRQVSNCCHPYKEYTVYLYICIYTTFCLHLCKSTHTPDIYLYLNLSIYLYIYI